MVLCFRPTERVLLDQDGGGRTRQLLYAPLVSIGLRGHITSEKAIATDPAKIEAVTIWKQPTDLKSFRILLGTTDASKLIILL